MFPLQYLRIGLMALLLFMSAMSYHPIFFSDFGPDAGGSGRGALSLYIMATTLALLMLTFNLGKIRSCHFIRKVFFLSLWAGFVAILILAIWDSKASLNDLQSILMGMLLLLIGFCAKLSYRQYALLAIVYIVTSVYTTYAQVTENIGGFIIADQYFINAKNSIGVLAASASVASFFIGLSSQVKKKYLKYTFLSLAVFLLFLLLTIRARASTLSVIAVFGFYYMRRVQLRRSEVIRIVIGGAALLVLLYMFGMLGSIGSYTVDSFTLNQDADITSGRTVRNAQALNIFLNEPFFGMLDTDAKVEWVHNYFLRVLSAYGMVGGFFLLFIYLYILYYIISVVRHVNVREIRYCGFFVMIIPFISSLAEPTFPYSPGTAVAFAFLSLGYSLSGLPHSKSKYETLPNIQ